MKLPALSVIIPNYNHAEYLPRSLGAILDQPVQPLEILVMDDASTDNSVEVIENLVRQHPHVRLHRNERNLGVVPNINRGIDLARGDYVLSAAADDEIVPGFLEKSLRLLAQHPQAALSATISDFREAHTGLNWLWGVGIANAPSYLSPARMVELEKQGKFFIPPNSVIMKRSALQEVGRFIPELKFCCDWYAMTVAAFRHGMCFVPEPLAICHVQPNSYYHRVRRDETEYRKTLEELLRRLHLRENKDVLPLLREAGSLFLFAGTMLKILLSHPEYRYLITPRFLRKNLSHSAKLFLKKLAPTGLVKAYMKSSGYRMRPT